MPPLGKVVAKGAVPPSGEEPAPYPTSFSHIVDLITNGQPIPGVKDVPDTVLCGQESQPMTAKRKKPWERTDDEVQGVTTDKKTEHG